MLCALFKLISPGFLKKDFLTEDLLDIHEKPFEKALEKQKALFLYYCNLRTYSSIQTENIQLANV